MKDSEPQLEAYHCGIRLLWFAIQQKEQSPVEGSTLCADGSPPGRCREISAVVLRLNRLIVSLPARAYRPVYMLLCLRNLADSVAVAPTLRLFTAIVGSFPASYQEAVDSDDDDDDAFYGTIQLRSEVIEGLCVRHSLLDAFFADLDRYKTSGERRPAAIPARLDFLKFILLNSAVTLNQEHLSQLWKLGVERDAPERRFARERDCFFQWIADVCPAVPDGNVEPHIEASQAFSMEHAKVLFLSSIATVRPEFMSVSAFRCIDRYTKLVNSVEGRIVVAPTVAESKSKEQSQVVQVLAPDLLGVDAIWSAAVTCRVSEVSRSASDLLLSLYGGLIPGADSPAQLRKAFVVECTRRIRDVLDAQSTERSASKAGAVLEDSDSEFEVNQCLNLLINFTKRVEESTQLSSDPLSVKDLIPARRDGGSGRGAAGAVGGDDLTVTVWYYDEKKTFDVGISTAATVFDFRDKVAKLVGLEPHEFRVVHKNGLPEKDHSQAVSASSLSQLPKVTIIKAKKKQSAMIKERLEEARNTAATAATIIARACYQRFVVITHSCLWIVCSVYCGCPRTSPAGPFCSTAVSDERCGADRPATRRSDCSGRCRRCAESSCVASGSCRLRARL